jgi:excisionase family DNA binding protein
MPVISLIDVHEAAQRLGFSECTLYRWCDSGILPHIHLGTNGRNIMFREDRLTAWIESYEKAGHVLLASAARQVFGTCLRASMSSMAVATSPAEEYLALAVVLGERALGQIEVERQEVLYVALEDTERQLRRRLDAVPTRILYFRTAWRERATRYGYSSGRAARPTPCSRKRARYRGVRARPPV